MPTESSKSSHPARYTDLLKLRVQPVLVTAIDRAAARNLMTASEYVRRSVIAHLKADGIDPSELQGAA